MGSEDDDGGAPPTLAKVLSGSGSASFVDVQSSLSSTSELSDHNALGMGGWLFAYAVNLVLLCMMAFVHTVLIERPAMRLRTLWKPGDSRGVGDVTPMRLKGAV